MTTMSEKDIALSNNDTKMQEAIKIAAQNMANAIDASILKNLNFDAFTKGLATAGKAASKAGEYLAQAVQMTTSPSLITTEKENYVYDSTTGMFITQKVKDELEPKMTVDLAYGYRDLQDDKLDALRYAGVVTKRMSSNVPNVSNIPKDYTEALNKLTEEAKETFLNGDWILQTKDDLYIENKELKNKIDMLMDEVDTLRYELSKLRKETESKFYVPPDIIRKIKI